MSHVLLRYNLLFLCYNILLSISPCNTVYVTDKEIAEGRQIINLLLISNGERQHYCLIKNMSRLVSQRTKNHSATLICRWYISHFTHLKSEHDKHMVMCRGIKHSPQADRMLNPKRVKTYFSLRTGNVECRSYITS